MRLHRLIAPVLLLCCLYVTACSDGFPPEFPAADFTLKSPQSGKTVSLSTVRGKPLIIYWFTSW